MPKYLIEGTYSAEGLVGLQKDKASGRRPAIKAAVEGRGGKLEFLYLALGERDLVGVVDFPDSVSAAAFGLEVSSSGLARTRTTALLTIEEADQAIAKKVAYKPPGRVG